MLRVVLLLSTLFLLLLAGTATLVSQRMAPLEPGGAEQLFTVDPGDPLTRVASRLERRGLIRDARALTWLAVSPPGGSPVKIVHAGSCSRISTVVRPSYSP